MMMMENFSDEANEADGSAIITVSLSAISGVASSTIQLLQALEHQMPIGLTYC